MEGLLWLAIVYVATAIPFWIIMRRIGHAWWAAAMAFVPIVNFLLFLIIALFAWPIPDARSYRYR